MTTAGGWRRVGVLALALLAGRTRAVFSFSPLIKCVDAKDLSSGRMREEIYVHSMIIDHCHLDRLPLDLAEVLPPRLEEVTLNMASVPAACPAANNRAAVVSCNRVTALALRGPSFGSPEAFEWIKMLFPNVTKLDALLGSLPIQSGTDVKACLQRDLAMSKVTALVVRYVPDKGDTCPLFENLKLFPGLVSISFERFKGAVLEDIQGAELALPRVKELVIYATDAGPGFSSRLSTVFPSLEKISVSGDTFREIISSRPNLPPHRHLVNVTIVTPHGDEPRKVFLGAAIASTCPSLKMISIINAGAVELPPNSGITRSLETVKAINIERSDLSCLPSFLDGLFPGLELLSAPNCKLQRLVDNASAFCGRAFSHSHLKHLDISDNPDLNGILTTMKPGQLEIQGKESGLSTMFSVAYYPFCESSSPERQAAAVQVVRMHNLAPLGGLYAPKLESLDMRQSFRDKLPYYFFHGCSKLTRLEMSFDFRHGYNILEWWECLWPLTELKTLKVEIVPYLSCYAPHDLKHREGFRGNTLKDVVEGLAETLKKAAERIWARPPVIELFHMHGMQPLTTVSFSGESR